MNLRDAPCGTAKQIAQQGMEAKLVSVSSTVCWGYSWYKFDNGLYGAKDFFVFSRSGSTGGGGSTTSGITKEQLKGCMYYITDSRADYYLNELNKAMNNAQINTCLRRSAFLAQVAHESACLRYFEEIASGEAYNNRKDLCNGPTDGPRYKGRGPIQLTGRCNYRAAGNALGLDLEGNPFQVSTREVGFRTTAWFWNSRSLNTYADQGPGSFDKITYRVNGGYNGKADRDAYYAACRRTLGC